MWYLEVRIWITVFLETGLWELSEALPYGGLNTYMIS